MEWITVLIIMSAVVISIVKSRVTIYDYERGVKYINGQYVKVLGPGKYIVMAWKDVVRKVDIRPHLIQVPGQEVISEDGVGLKISIAAEYEIADPYLALNKVDNYAMAVYTHLQLALRDVVSAMKIEDIMQSRNAINRTLFEQSAVRMVDFGVTLKSASVKDMMFPGELKKIFSQVVQAKKEGLAALEKARGETAALRQLANAARMLESNPTLLKLKMLQSTGNTLMVGWPDPLMEKATKERKTQK